MFESIIFKVNSEVFKSSPDVMTLSHSRLCLSCRQLRFHCIEADAAYQADLQVQVLQGYCAGHDALVKSNTLSTDEWVLYQDTSIPRPVLPSTSFN